MKKFKSPWNTCRLPSLPVANLAPVQQKKPLLTASSPINPPIPCEKDADTNFFLQFDPDQISDISDMDQFIAMNQKLCDLFPAQPCTSQHISIFGNFQFLAFEDLQNGPPSKKSVPIGTKQDLESSKRHGGAMDPVGKTKRLGIYNFNDETYCSRQLKSLYAIVTTEKGLFYLPFVSSKNQHRYFIFKNAECKELDSDYVISGNAIYYINQALEELMKNVTLLHGTEKLKPTGVYVSNNKSIMPSLVIHCGPEKACDLNEKKIEWFVETLVISALLVGAAEAFEAFTLVSDLVSMEENLQIQEQQLAMDLENASTGVMPKKDIPYSLIPFQDDIILKRVEIDMIRKIAPNVRNIQAILYGATVANTSNIIPEYMGYYIKQLENCDPKCWYKDDVITSINGFSVNTPFERKKKYLMFGPSNQADSNYQSQRNAFHGDTALTSFTMKINDENFDKVSIKTQHGCEMTNQILSFSPELVKQLLSDFTKEHPDFVTTLTHGQQGWTAINGNISENNPLRY